MNHAIISVEIAVSTPMVGIPKIWQDVDEILITCNLFPNRN